MYRRTTAIKRIFTLLSGRFKLTSSLQLGVLLFGVDLLLRGRGWRPFARLKEQQREHAEQAAAHESEHTSKVLDPKDRPGFLLAGQQLRFPERRKNKRMLVCINCLPHMNDGERSVVDDRQSRTVGHKIADSRARHLRDSHLNTEDPKERSEQKVGEGRTHLSKDSPAISIVNMSKKPYAQ